MSILFTDEQIEEIGDEFLVGEGPLGNVLRKVSECHAPNCGAIPAGLGRSPQSHSAPGSVNPCRIQNPVLWRRRSYRHLPLG